MALGIILLIFAYLLYRYSKSKRFNDPKPHKSDSCKSFVACNQFPMVQQDERQMETIKRVHKAFKDQQEQMQARAMKAHDSSCVDPVFCTKSPCFVYEPDKIVGTETVARKTNSQRRATRKKELADTRH